MAFTKKTWKDRIAQYLNRRRLTDVDTGDIKTVTVTRDEGGITEEGDIFNAATMNDLENRINTAFTEVNAKTGSDIPVSTGETETIAEAIDAIGTTATASWTGTSSSAYGTNLTGAITLTKGVYIVTIKTPVSDITPLIELHDNTNDRPFYYTNIPSQGSFTIPIELTATTDIIVRSGASAAASYSYLERGGLFAVRIK